MLRPIHLYIFRVFALVFISSLTLVSLLSESSVITSLVSFPTVLVISLSALAILDNKLLNRVSWKRKYPVKAYKFVLKPVNTHRHAGCKLLGLSCAA